MVPRLAGEGPQDVIRVDVGKRSLCLAWKNRLNWHHVTGKGRRHGRGTRAHLLLADD